MVTFISSLLMSFTSGSSSGSVPSLLSVSFGGPIVAWDRKLFVLINSRWTSSIADQFFPWVTDIQKDPYFLCLLALLLGYWIFRRRVNAAKWIAVAAISMSLSDIVAYRVLKPFFHRERPPQAQVEVVVRGVKHIGDSFPSNHASNVFAAAMALSGGLPTLMIPLFALASLIAYSRIYVGAHFPLDVCVGAAVGILIATLVRLALAKWLRPERKESD